MAQGLAGPKCLLGQSARLSPGRSPVGSTQAVSKKRLPALSWTTTSTYEFLSGGLPVRVRASHETIRCAHGGRCLEPAPRVRNCKRRHWQQRFRQIDPIAVATRPGMARQWPSGRCRRPADSRQSNGYSAPCGICDSGWWSISQPERRPKHGATGATLGVAQSSN